MTLVWEDGHEIRKAPFGSVTANSKGPVPDLGGLVGKMGSGVVAKTGHVTYPFLLVCLVGVVFIPDLWKLVPLGVAGVGYGGYMLYAWWFSKHYPILAAMDGTTAVAYLKADLAAKDPKVIDGSSRPVSNPSLAPDNSGSLTNG
jgi:hypothetical protein